MQPREIPVKYEPKSYVMDIKVGEGCHPGRPIVLKFSWSGQGSRGREGRGAHMPTVGRGAGALVQLHLLLHRRVALSIPRDGPAPGWACYRQREASLTAGGLGAEGYKALIGLSVLLGGAVGCGLWTWPFLLGAPALNLP